MCCPCRAQSPGAAAAALSPRHPCCAPALGHSWFLEFLNHAGNAHGDPGLGRRCAQVPGLADGPESPGNTAGGDWGAPVGTGLGCPSLQAQAVKTPSRASVPAQFPHFCGWAQFWCLQTSLWDTTGSSPHSQCGATWKLHFMWKWTLLPQTQLKYSLCHF